MPLPCRTANPLRLRCACWLLPLWLGMGFLSQADSQSADAILSSNEPVAVVVTNVISTNVIPTTISLAPETNPAAPAGGTLVENFNTRLATARFLEKTSQPDKAEPILISLLSERVPDSIKQAALFELGAAIRMENDLPRAVSVCAQFVDRWPDDPRIPEVLLREGQIYRQMGLNGLALTKFYAVMTAALSLKSDRPEYYPALVLEAQIEIAETHYLMGHFNEAAEFYSRLLKQSDPALNRHQAQFRLIRCLTSIDHSDEAVSQALDFLSRYPDAPEQPEVRFYLAQTFKQLGRNNEALQQVLLLLQEEKLKTQDHPEVWAYWQQRAGNEVANQLYREGDYMRALEIYINLSQLDSAPVWQLPVKYQIGLTYERLQQPQKAIDTYNDILKLEPEVGTNASPGQKSVFDMARWRAGFLGWQGHAETMNRSIALSTVTSAETTTNLPPATNLP